MTITRDRGLRWFRSVTDETPNVHRGFCAECGSSLFWDARDGDNIGFVAGSLDDSGALGITGHIWLDQKAGYYDLHDDLPKFREGWGSDPVREGE
jgi:hypothetical protein